MEYLGNSTNNLSEFEFKYIPKSQFQKVIREVESKRRSRSKGMWGDFCTISSELNGDDFIKNGCAMRERVATPNDVYNVMKSNRIKMPSTVAPLFGPPRKYDMESLRRNQTPKVSSSPNKYRPGKVETRCISSVHIVEEVNVADIQQNHQTLNDKTQVAEQITANDDVNDEKSSSIECSSDNDETLYSEILDLCNEIENSNELDENTGDEMEMHSNSKKDKIKSKTIKKQLIPKANGRTIDEELDLLDAECESLADDEKSNGEEKALRVENPRPTGGLRTENFSHKPNESKSRHPKTKNQMSKSEFRTDSGGKSSAKIQSLTRKNVEANNKSNDKVTFRPKSQESSASLKDLTVLRRVSGYQEKICEYLGQLLHIIDNPPELDDVADLNRRQIRASEFTHRFARNHLYPIGRLAEEIRLMPDNPMDIVTKVNSLFQIIMQAVQTYLKNIEMFIYNKNPDKLLVVVDFIINASKICFDRKVFDKNDVLVVKMLRKCGDMREFLIQNHDSKAVFYGVSRKADKVKISEQARVLGGRKLKNSWSIVNDFRGNVKNPYQMTDVRPKKHRVRRNSLTSRGQHEVRAHKIHFEDRKSPYECPISPYSIPTMKPKSKPASRVNSGIHSTRSVYVQEVPQKVLKKSTSDVSTVMQKEMEKEKVAEKPLEDDNRTDEIMKMIQNITKEKFEEMLAPVIAKLVPKTEEIKIPQSHRVTADVEPSKKSMDIQKSAENQETIQRIAHNVQYHFVKSLSDDQEDIIDEMPKATEPMAPPSTSKAIKTNEVKMSEKPPISERNIDSRRGDVDDDFDHKKLSINELREQALKERMAVVEKMSENPLYTNEHIKQPCKLFSDISDHILDEMLQSIIKEMNFNDKEFVENFLKSELAC